MKFKDVYGDLSNTIYEGDLDCSNNDLTSLEGCPKEVKGDFDCSSNNLTSLDGSPEIVSGYFDCSYNKLTSLEGCPKEVKGNFYCSNNNLISLNGLPFQRNNYTGFPGEVFDKYMKTRYPQFFI